MSEAEKKVVDPEVIPPEKQNVMQGGVTVTKKSLGKKLWDTFIGEDAHNIGTYIIGAILVPTVKDVIVGMVQAALYGGYDNRSSFYNGGYRRDYNSISKSSPSNRRSGYDDVPRGYDDYNSINFDFRSDAQIVLNEWREYLSEYGRGSIADYYDIVRECYNRSGKKIQIESTWTDSYRGWYKDDMQAMRVVPMRGRYYIDMPRPADLRK